MTWQPEGTVYGVLLNFRSEFDALAPRMHEAPYQAPPRAPVLYVKTANTFNTDGGTVALAPDVPEVEVGATVGLVLGPQGRVERCVLAADFTVPHASYFRPPVAARCRDGFLGLGSPVTLADPQDSRIEVRVNGTLRQAVAFDALVRAPRRLLEDVAEFMTLGAGDVLLLGCEAPGPRVRVGDHVELRAGALGTLHHTVAAEDA